MLNNLNNIDLIKLEHYDKIIRDIVDNIKHEDQNDSNIKVLQNLRFWMLLCKAK